MCGFLTIQMRHGRPVDRALLAAMNDMQSHRGPDDHGLHIDGAVGLAHRRLSILDLTPSGHQPMCNEDGTVWIVFNGEIYNYVELAQGLRARGHIFRSGSDTEVIVHLWEEHGPRCVDHLNGMFAFMIWDARRGELFGARDRMGIKPFFYHEGADRFIAASEIKSILRDPAVARRPDPQGLSDHFLAGSSFEGRTCFADVRQLLPGHALSVRDGVVTTWKYWDLTFAHDRGRSAADTLDGLRALLDDAVAVHCRSDARLGCHLSGGLDSSTVVALAARHHDPLETFSIRFDGGPFFDESAHARAVARHVGTQHWESRPAPDDLVSLLASLAWHCDLPMPNHTMFAYHAASRLAAERVKVALTGHGGDEVFAGYPAQFRAAFGDTSMFDLSARPTGRLPVWGRLRTALRRHGVMGLARRLARRSATPPAQDLRSLWVALHCGTVPLEDPFLAAAFRRSLAGYDSRDAYLAPLDAAPSDDVLDRCLYHDLRSYLPGLLHQEDRASMAVSIESRVPLLDYRVVEYLATVPPDLKVPGRVPKGLLRQVATDLLPAEVVTRRDKGAFGVPGAAWFRGPLRDFVRSILHSPRTAERGIFEPRELRSTALTYEAMWAVVATELWFRLYIDEDRELLDRVGEASRRADPPVGQRVAL